MEDKGVIYVRRIPEETDPNSIIGRSWRTVFNTTTKEETEMALTKLEYTWEWHDDGDLTIRNKALPAVKVSSNGRKAYYN